MNILCDLLAIQRNGILYNDIDVNFLAIWQHEIKGLKLFHFLNRVDKGITEYNELVHR